jgi:hypothetical protein
MRKPSEHRSLLPHEHGAYGQIAMPILCGLALGRPGPGAWLLATGAFLGFLSYEPLLVASGRRGRRTQEDHGARARRLAAWFLAAAVALSGAGFVLSPPEARLAAAVPPVLAAGIALLVWMEVERTVPGEVAVAVALSSVGFPVGVASGARPGAAPAAWLAWSLGFAAATLAVEVVLARSRSPARDPGPAALGGVVLLEGVALALAFAGVVPAVVPVAVAPLAVSSLAVILLRVQARRLKAVGWATLAGSAATLAVLVSALR